MRTFPRLRFTCGRIGHSDLLCPTPRTRDEHGNLPFGKSLRAQDERRKSVSGDSSTRDQQATQNSKVHTRHSSIEIERGSEVTSPVKHKNQNKRKG